MTANPLKHTHTHTHTHTHLDSPLPTLFRGFESLVLVSLMSSVLLLHTCLLPLNYSFLLDVFLLDGLVILCFWFHHKPLLSEFQLHKLPTCCSDWIENESKSKMGKKRKTFFPLNTLLELRRRREEGRRGKRGRRGKGEEGEKEGEERRRGRAGELGCE